MSITNAGAAGVVVEGIPRRAPVASGPRAFGLVGRIGIAALIGAASVAAGPTYGAEARVPHEQVEWTWSEFPDTVDPSLPDVLLEGDSITRNYYHDVRRRLAGRANVFLFATSACVGDPALTKQIRSYSQLARRNFTVIHFNNGMHGWKLSEAQYQAGFPAYVSALRSTAPAAKLVWASTTYARTEGEKGASSSRIDLRNRIAQQIVDGRGIGIDDQNALMRDKVGFYEDDVHFAPAGAAVQGEAAASAILAKLR